MRQHLEATYGADSLYEDGLEVHTTLDARLQAAASAAVERQLRVLYKRHGYRAPVRNIVADGETLARDIGAYPDDICVFRSHDHLPGTTLGTIMVFRASIPYDTERTLPAPQPADGAFNAAGVNDRHVKVADLRRGSLGERVRAHLEPDDFARHPLAAFVVPVGDCVVARPQAAPLPPGVRIIDPAVEATGVEPQGIRHP